MCYKQSSLFASSYSMEARDSLFSRAAADKHLEAHFKGVFL